MTRGGTCWDDNEGLFGMTRKGTLGTGKNGIFLLGCRQGFAVEILRPEASGTGFNTRGTEKHRTRSGLQEEQELPLSEMACLRQLARIAFCSTFHLQRKVILSGPALVYVCDEAPLILGWKKP